MHVCKHCGEQIEHRNFLLGPKWVHVSGGMGDYTYCRLRAAEPVEERG
jgi:hypothetical protein